MKKYQEMIEKYNIPGRDLYDLPSSHLRFSDGAHYRNELSGIETLDQMEDLIKEMEKRKIPIHRVIALGSSGTSMYTFKELQEFALMGKEAQIEVIAIPQPRAHLDIGKHTASEWGRYSGIRVRGSDMVCYLLQDILRCIEAGIRGFLLFGEDVLSLFQQMRKKGDLPDNLVFKLSYTAGVSNAAGCLLAEQLGADSINPITDLTLPMLASMRKAVKIPLDIVTIDLVELGVVNRFWECSEIIRVCSPCYNKLELHIGKGIVKDAKTGVKYCEVLRELIFKQNPELILSEQGPKDLRIPQP